METTEAGAWAHEEFGDAQLGDARRTARLVAIGSGVAARPSGQVTSVFGTSAERTATFRFVENEDVRAVAIASATHRASARRAAEYPFVFVPTDGSSLTLTDREKAKGLGVVGARSIGARGLQVMTAIAVAPDGTPLGIVAQEWWARKGRARRKKKGRDRRELRSKETQYWLDTMLNTRAVFAGEAPKTVPWFQLDRGGDAWAVVLDGLEPGQLFTVRAAHDRRLWGKGDEPRRHLWEKVESEPVLGSYDLEVTGRPGRKARTATMDVRVCEVTLDFRNERTGKHEPATLWAVLTRETSAVSEDEESIEWLLLTTHPVRTLEDAIFVVRGYAARWRVEEFHKAWKTGACNVEDTQLRDRESIVKWATILAAVAIRILRLTYLARHQPDLPATVELEPFEVQAIVAVKTKRPPRQGAKVSIGQAVLWLAPIGGATGKSSGGPPGAIVISRGLERIQVLADFFANLARKM
jgi:hypothetical protein